MDSPLQLPRRPPRRIRRRPQQRRRQDRIAEGCAVEWIYGSRHARCAEDR
jgi:hypothetical protein